MWIIQIPCCLLAILDLYFLNHLTHSQETALLSPTPQIHRLTPNFISDMLEVEWYDGGSVFLEEMDATWQIQILRKELTEEVALETYHSKLSAHKKLLHWTWTSDLPFNCTTHYVRIRCQLHGNTLEESKWGQWSQVANITGKDTGSTTQMYPIDRMVQVGSDVTFCCVWKNGQSLISVHYADCSTEWCWTSPLSERSMLIHVHNVRASIQSGNNAWCNLQNYPGPDEVLTGTVLFVGCKYEEFVWAFLH
ncbi:leukemia inhibitory factor receptor-like [Varanus komodoensis]|uniref:leukemia inhibitory factor receptor-like n=1 Tax=Varanus komodoensis TaxID=61221 RepID=UPI001CF7D382|nr:leukemia inhibitory factor receptor-like [Varanus komodoensis]